MKARITFGLGELGQEFPAFPKSEISGSDAVGGVAFVGHDLPPVELGVRGPPAVLLASLLQVFGHQVDVGFDGQAVRDVSHAAW